MTSASPAHRPPGTPPEVAAPHGWGRRLRAVVVWSLVVVVACVGLALAGRALLGPLAADERTAFDPAAGRTALPPSPDGSEATSEPGTDLPSAPDATPLPSTGDAEPITATTDGDGYVSFLILGSDRRDSLAGERADVIMVALVPDTGHTPVVLSLPRDLWVPNPCTHRMSRLNAGLNGCGTTVSGPELMAVMVEDLTGLRIDHSATLDFEGFIEVVDVIGGVHICTEHPVREDEWSLPGGCLEADGEQALGWVASRRTQELVDGRWRAMPGVSDLQRNERQQQLLLQVFDRATSVRSPTALSRLADGLAGSVTLSESVSVPGTARLAWGLRDLEGSDVRRVSVPVRSAVTSGGAAVLHPTTPVDEVLVQTVGDEPWLDGR